MLVRPLIALSALALLACGVPAEGGELTGKGDGTQWEAAGPLGARIGTVLLVDHFIASPVPGFEATLQSGPPGGIIFWNGDPQHRGQQRNAAQLRHTITHYSRIVRDAGHPPLLFATDYEGGALKRTPDGATVPGVQRFTEGFTRLAHPRWLGAMYRTDPALGEELAFLHGRIIAREMASVGINYPLSVASDLAHRLFSYRGIDTDPQIVATAITAVLDGWLSQPGVVFATKHFPGLGQTRGDTHDRIVRSHAAPAEIERGLLPFRAAVAHARARGEEDRLSFMCGHAAFSALDPERHTTTSPTILTDLLRDGGEGLPLSPVGLRGIAVSDAMWMGPYAQDRIGWGQLRRVLLQSLLAGMDLLMIPSQLYPQAVDYLRSVYDDRVSASERRALEELLDMPWATIHARLGQRLTQSIERIDRVRRALPHAVDAVAPASATAIDAAARARYHELLGSIGHPLR